MVYGLTDIGKNLCGLRSDPNILRSDEFWAIKDISFDVKKGEAFALVGANGAGKTTLLKMLNGIFWPDEGKISVKGTLGPLIAVGAGFHPLLSGRDNIYINAAILGIGKQEIQKKFDEIVAFADIGEFLDTPVKHYSSGMFVRLGFSVAVHCEPEILLIDEILSVGDMAFQTKCKVKMDQFINSGKTIVYISHNLDTVINMCQRALFLQEGRMVYAGDAKSVVYEYRKSVLNQEKRVIRDGIRHGTGDVVIKKVELFDKQGQERDAFEPKSYMKIKIHYEAIKLVNNPQFRVRIFTNNKTIIIDANSCDHNTPIGSIQGKGEVSYEIESLPFNVGRYPLSVVINDSTGMMVYDAHEHLHEFTIDPGPDNLNIPFRSGILFVPGQWTLDQKS
jgi:ABC-type polysaccharide/polyol phosphate transport system ATPase subunit